MQAASSFERVVAAQTVALVVAALVLVAVATRVAWSIRMARTNLSFNTLLPFVQACGCL